MRIRYLTTGAGPTGVHRAGDRGDVPPDEAKALIAGGYAVPDGAAEQPAITGREQAAASAPNLNPRRERKDRRA